MSSFSYIDNANNEVPDASQYRFGIVVTEWNNHITDTLLEGAVQTLKQYGVAESSITIERVPGSFELIYACSQLAKRGYLDAVIAIGCVIKGDTPTLITSVKAQHKELLTSMQQPILLLYMEYLL